MKFEKSNPQRFNQRSEELKNEGILESNLMRVTFAYGNDHELIKEAKTTKSGYRNEHRWTVFVRMADKKDSVKKYISKVRFGMDPTFGVTH